MGGVRTLCGQRGDLWGDDSCLLLEAKMKELSTVHEYTAKLHSSVDFILNDMELRRSCGRPVLPRVAPRVWDQGVARGR